MTSVRSIIGTFLLIAGVASSLNLHAEVLQKTFKSSPDAAKSLGTTWHKVVLDADRKTFAVRSLNALGNPVAELTSTKQGVYTLNRFSGQSRAKKLTEQITIDSNKGQASLKTSNRAAFDKWARLYVEELSRNTLLLDRSATKSENSDDCDFDCARDFFVCSGVTAAAAIASGGVGGFGMVFCYAELLYCMVKCPPSMHGPAGTGGYTPHGDCERNGCDPGQKCCDDGYCAAGPCATPEFGTFK